MPTTLRPVFKEQTSGSTSFLRGPNPYTRDGGDRCKSGSRSLLTCLQFSPSLNEARSCRNQLANDDILFQAHQVIRLSLYRCLCQDTCGLLEGGRRQEAIRIERRLGDT